MGEDARKSEEASALQIRKIGDDLGLILPDQLLRRLGVVEGGLVHLVEDVQGGFRLTHGDPGAERNVAAASHAGRVSAIVEDLIVEYDATLRALAR